MKKKWFAIMAVILLTVLCGSGFTSCTKVSKSDKEYWFSSYDSDFVDYDDEAENITEAGKYWNMTVKNDCTVTISVRVNVGWFSELLFYINEELVTGVTEGIYSEIYKDVKLKKGDKLKFHACWTNRVVDKDDGFTISVFSIKDNTGDYLIKGIE